MASEHAERPGAAVLAPADRHRGEVDVSEDRERGDDRRQQIAPRELEHAPARPGLAHPALARAEALGERRRRPLELLERLPGAQAHEHRVGCRVTAQADKPGDLEALAVAM